MMPEGPEVRTLVDQLQPAVGQRLVDLKFLSGRYTRHGTPRGFDGFWPTMTERAGGGRDGAGSDRSTVDVDVDVDVDVNVDVNVNVNVDRLVEWRAKGKFIYMVLDDGRQGVTPSTLEKEKGGEDDYLRSIWITLGMSGRFMNDSVIREDNNARWYLEFWNADTGTARKIYFLDTRNFGTLRFSLSKRELMDKINGLGPDILDDCTEEIFMGVMDKAKPGLNVCKFLMNQKVSS